MLVMALLAGSFALAFESRNIEALYGVNITVNGQPWNPPEDQRPFITSGRTFLPVAGIAQVLDVPVRWDGDTRTVHIGESPAPTPTPAPSPTPAPPAARIGDIITFGEYTWQVLDIQNNRALIITEDVIGTRQYHRVLTGITWHHSDIRQWLNGEFFESFTEAERRRIAETNLINENNPTHNTSGGVDTTDRIFLLSISEANRLFADDDARRAVDANRRASWWWLRSPGVDPGGAADVDDGGYVRVTGFIVDSDHGGVRPALWLNL